MNSAGGGSRGSTPPHSNSGFLFTDVTQKAGINWKRTIGAYGGKLFPEAVGGGGAFIDYDKDGFVDILLINGDWVDALSPSGRVLWSTHPPGVYYPSDSNEVKPGLYVTVGWQDPGILETFDREGRLRWRYQPRPGDPPLNQPSLAEPLPNGDFLVTDDFNDRVIVVDPRTDRVVWQYGHTGAPGTAPGYLNRPDGVDLVPPAALLSRVHASVGLRP